MKTAMPQEFSFTKLIGAGSMIVTVHYNYDENVNCFDDIAVVTDEGVEITGYLAEETLNDLEFDCYPDLEKKLAQAKLNDEYDRGEARYLDRMEAA